MDLLCEEEIIWSPCLPHIDDESDIDQSSSISSPPLTSSNSSIDCFSNSNSFIDSSATIVQCSNFSCINSIDYHQCTSTCCHSTSFCDLRPTSASQEATPSLPCIDEQELKHMLENQFEYMPEKLYYEELQLKNLGAARCRAMQWLIGAQSKFNFTHTTIALAINYFDRYLSKNLSKVWSNWMLELLSTACLSIAAKMDEVVVPPLLDLQQGARKHAFHPSTIQRMELLLLSSLQWKMRSITPFSFVDIALCGINISSHIQHLLNIRVSKLLFGALLDAESLQFDPCTLAASSIFYALGEIAPHIHQFTSAQVSKQINQDNFRRCCELMEDYVPSCLSNDKETDITSYGYVNDQLMTSVPQHCEGLGSCLFENFYGFHRSAFSISPKKRKRE